MRFMDPTISEVAYYEMFVVFKKSQNGRYNAIFKSIHVKLQIWIFSSSLITILSCNLKNKNVKPIWWVRNTMNTAIHFKLEKIDIFEVTD